MTHVGVLIEVVVKLQLSAEQLSQLSDILPHLGVDTHTHTLREREGGGEGRDRQRLA